MNRVLKVDEATKEAWETIPLAIRERIEHDYVELPNNNLFSAFVYIDSDDALYDPDYGIKWRAVFLSDNKLPFNEIYIASINESGTVTFCTDYFIPLADKYKYLVKGGSYL